VAGGWGDGNNGGKDSTGWHLGSRSERSDLPAGPGRQWRGTLLGSTLGTVAADPGWKTNHVHPPARSRRTFSLRKSWQKLICSGFGGFLIRRSGFWSHHFPAIHLYLLAGR